MKTDPRDKLSAFGMEFDFTAEKPPASLVSDGYAAAVARFSESVREMVEDLPKLMSGEEVADLFWGLDANAQARFFNHLISKERLNFQLQAVTGSPSLTIEGRVVMSRIGEYSAPNTTA